MTAQETIGETYDARHDHDALRAREADYTPRPVVEQMFARLKARDPSGPMYFLDPAAGSGVFGQVCRATWRRAIVTSVEPFPSEWETLSSQARGTDWVCRYTLEDYLPECGTHFDLIAGNPPFSKAREFVDLCRSVLTENGRLVLLLPARWSNRGEARASWLHKHVTAYAADGSPDEVWEWPNLPLEEWPIAGSIKYRSGLNPKTGKKYSADVRDYSWHVYGKNPRTGPPGELPAVSTHYLPWLPSDQRQWVIRPGTETTNDG